MFNILEGIVKATVGLAVETPIALVKDVVTLGGSITEESQPYTVSALEKVSDNISKITE